MNIFIVGGGNIGQRHIQSTLNLDPSFTINIVEINQKKPSGLQGYCQRKTKL